MSEEASDVFGTQSIVKDGATYGFFQHTEQHNLFINLSKGRKRVENGSENSVVIYVVPNLYNILSSVKHKRRILFKVVVTNHLYNRLCDERVEMRHEFAVHVSDVEVLSDNSDETHSSIADPQIGVTQERSCGTVTIIHNNHKAHYTTTYKIAEFLSPISLTNS